MYRFLKTSGPLNHRFVADPDVLRQMQARGGWKLEGVAFCVMSAQRYPLGRSLPEFEYFPIGGPLAAKCDNGPGRNSTCIESDHMPVLATVRAVPDYPASTLFASRTGAAGLEGYAYTLPFGSDEEASEHSFAQVFTSSPRAGFFVTSRDRVAGDVSSLRSRTTVSAMEPPFLVGYEVEMDLMLDYRLFVKRVRSEGAGNETYVQPLVTLADSRSGLRIVLSPGAIGTPRMNDGTFRDAATGDVLVFIALAPQTSIGRSSGLPALQVTKGFDSENPWGYGGDFQYRINRSEFVRVLERARTLEPRLSTEPGDYRVESFGLKGEVAGVGEIGYQVERLELSVIRP